MKRLVAVAALLLAIGTPTAAGAGVGPHVRASILPHGPRAIVTPISFVTMYSDAGDFVGQGQQRLFSTAAGNSVTISGTAASFDVNVSGGPDSFIMEFAAAPGDSLQPGLYTGAQRASFREPGHPGIDIFGDGRGCNTVSGRFDVKSIGTDAGGNVDALWLTYEEHCEGGTAALFGAIQINVLPQPSLQPMPQAVWWPDTYPGVSSTTIPVRFVATGGSSLTVSSVGLVGPDKASFQIAQDNCTGMVLAPGASCQVWLTFVPLLKGPHLATLQVNASGGVTETAQLDGAGIGGRTELVMHSDSGDFVGQGLSYDYTPSNSVIAASGSATEVEGGVSSWQLIFTPPTGQVLTPGKTYTAVRWPFNGGKAGMEIFGQGRGCNTLRGTFTVNSLALASDGSLQSTSISFVQHCEGATPALRGTLYWRSPTGDNIPNSGVTGLTLARSNDGTQTIVSWANPAFSWSNPHNADWAYTIVRYLTAPTAPGSPNGSLFAYEGSGTSVTLPVDHTQPVTVAVYAVDKSGNVSPVQTATIPAS
jgi:hypothetical protein